MKKCTFALLIAIGFIATWHLSEAVITHSPKDSYKMIGLGHQKQATQQNCCSHKGKIKNLEQQGLSQKSPKIKHQKYKLKKTKQNLHKIGEQTKERQNKISNAKWY